MTLKEYRSSGQPASMIEFLESGNLFDYVDVTRPSRIVLPGAITHIAGTSAKDVGAFNRKEIQPCRVDDPGIYRPGHFFETIYASRNDRIYLAEAGAFIADMEGEPWSVSNFFMALGKARLPIDFKLQYLASIKDAGQSC